MKPCQLLFFTAVILLFTAAYSEPASCYFDTGSNTPAYYRERLYAGKDTQKLVDKYQYLAHELYSKGRFKRAIVQWKKVLKLQPANAFAMFMLGKSYIGAGETVRGEALCDQAISMSAPKVNDICHSVEELKTTH
jgi:tetratricopeptide (TPR) repeat protein